MNSWVGGMDGMATITKRGSATPWDPELTHCALTWESLFLHSTWPYVFPKSGWLTYWIPWSHHFVRLGLCCQCIQTLPNTTSSDTWRALQWNSCAGMVQMDGCAFSEENLFHGIWKRRGRKSQLQNGSLLPRSRHCLRWIRGWRRAIMTMTSMPWVNPPCQNKQ